MANPQTAISSKYHVPLKSMDDLSRDLKEFRIVDGVLTEIVRGEYNDRIAKEQMLIDLGITVRPGELLTVYRMVNVYGEPDLKNKLLNGDEIIPKGVASEKGLIQWYERNIGDDRLKLELYVVKHCVVPGTAHLPHLGTLVTSTTADRNFDFVERSEHRSERMYIEMQIDPYDSRVLRGGISTDESSSEYKEESELSLTWELAILRKDSYRAFTEEQFMERVGDGS
jgi:hypothetical protein